MKRFLWAALLALPLLAAVEQRASAWGCCDCQSHFFPCYGIVPGPWYLYWPSGCSGAMSTGDYYSAGWSYPCHFQTPAPVGGSPCYEPPGQYPGYWYGR